MNSRLLALPVMVAVLSLSGRKATAAESTETVVLQRATEIPGDTLRPGRYTFTVEDRMQDRAIVRVSGVDSDQHFLLLVVPSAKLRAQGRLGVAFFPSRGDDDQILRGWVCPGCGKGLEFAYPKLEAVKIVGKTGESALAVDPVSDKLPADLSSDDMKVVTLWLLSPERVDANNRGVGLKAVKYSAGVRTQSGEIASAQPPAARSHLPKTASDNYLLILCGGLCFGLAALLRVRGSSRRTSCMP